MRSQAGAWVSSPAWSKSFSWRRGRLLALTSQAAQAVLRVRSRAQHRLQRALGRDAPRRHRAAPTGPGVLGGDRHEQPSRPDDGRGLLPALQPRGGHGPAGGDQLIPPSGLGASASGVSRQDSGHRRRCLHRSYRRGDQAGHGHLLQRHLGLLGAPREPRQHIGAALPRPPRRQPPEPRRGGRIVRQGDRPLPASRICRGLAPRRHRLRAHGPVRPLGRRGCELRLRLRRPRQPHQAGSRCS